MQLHIKLVWVHGSKKAGVRSFWVITETLQFLFEVGMRNGWFLWNLIWFTQKTKSEKLSVIPHIPEEVMQQLNQHLDKLLEPIMRMALVIQEVTVESLSTAN